MGHGDRTALRDLLLEDGNDAAIRPKNVSEAHGGENGNGRVGILLALNRELLLNLAVLLSIVLDDHLAHALGGTHNRCRIDRLVGRDENETFDLELVCQANRVQRAENVVLDSLTGTNFHKRNVFMSSRMEYRIRLILNKYIAQTTNVADATDLNANLDIVVLTHDLILKKIRVVLPHVEDNNTLWGNRCHLTAELGANGTRAARDKNGLSGNVATNHAGVQNDLLATKKVSDVYFTQLDVIDLVNGELANIGQRAKLAIRFGANAVNALTLIKRGGRNSNDDLLDIEPRNKIRDILACAKNANAVNALLLLCGVVVYSDNGVTKHIGVVRDHTIDSKATGFAGADDQGTRPIESFRRSSELALLRPHDTILHADASDENDLKDECNAVNTDRHPFPDSPKENGRNKNSKTNRYYDTQHVIGGSVLPKIVV